LPDTDGKTRRLEAGEGLVLQKAVSGGMDGRHGCPGHMRYRVAGEGGQTFPARHALPSCFFSRSWPFTRIGLVNQDFPLLVVWHDRCLLQGTGASESEEKSCTSNLSLSALHLLWGRTLIINDPAARPRDAGHLSSHQKEVCSLSMRRVLETSQELNSSSLRGREE
jgi:hypothetical protein